MPAAGISDDEDAGIVVRRQAGWIWILDFGFGGFGRAE